MLDKSLADVIDKIDLSLDAPVDEPARQHYFMKKMKLIIKKESEKIGRPLTSCIVTFG